MRKNVWAKIVASIWLLAIVVSIVWSWIVMILSSKNTEQNVPEFSQEELNDFLKKYSSWATVWTSTWITIGTQTWVTNTWVIENNTWTTK